MKLKIDIPEHAYEECKNVKLTEALEGVPFHVMKAIANGIPVSQENVGYWKVIDEKSAVCSCCNRLNILNGEFCKWCGARME